MKSDKDTLPVGRVFLKILNTPWGYFPIRSKIELLRLMKLPDGKGASIIIDSLV